MTDLLHTSRIQGWHPEAVILSLQKIHAEDPPRCHRRRGILSWLHARLVMGLGVEASKVSGCRGATACNTGKTAFVKVSWLDCVRESG